MYEPSEKWSAYYAELDPQERLKLYNEAADADDAEDAFLARLYDERYRDPRLPDRAVDTWLWKFVYLPGLFRKRRVSKGAFHKEVEQTLRELHLCEPLTEAQRRALYLEYRNAARRFFLTCLGKRYGSRMFGMKEADLAQKKEKAAGEIWMMTRGVALASGRAQEMELFCAALWEELAAFCPNYENIFEKLEKQYKQYQ